jgi:hypothetical protein
MKNIQLCKSVVIGALLVASLGAGGAQAQTVYSGAVKTPDAFSTVASDSHQPATSSQNYQSPIIMRGGYNVGRTAVQNVPGCNGPISLCNLYFGN